MRPILFSIGNIHIYGYGLMIALGVIAAVAVTCFRAKRYYNVDPDLIFNAGIIGIISGLVGAKLTYWIVEIKSVIQNPSMLLNLGGGFVVYGGVILGVLVPVLYLRFVKKTTALDKVDLAVSGIALGQAIGRIGCLFAGCCYGAAAPEGAWFAIHFPAGAEAPAGIGLYPTQIISAVGDFALFLFLALYLRRARFRGEVTTYYMMLYAVGRFLVEFLRDDPRGNVGALSTSQFISIFMFVAGAALWFVFRKKNDAPLKSNVTFNMKTKKAKKKKNEAAEEMIAGAENPEEKTE